MRNLIIAMLLIAGTMSAQTQNEPQYEIATTDLIVDGVRYKVNETDYRNRLANYFFPAIGRYGNHGTQTGNLLSWNSYLVNVPRWTPPVGTEILLHWDTDGTRSWAIPDNLIRVRPHTGTSFVWFFTQYTTTNPVHSPGTLRLRRNLWPENRRPDWQ